MTTQLPPALKPIAQFLQRAVELEKREPLIAFYCRTYAAQLGIEVIQSLPAKDEAATRYVINLMDRLETDKQELNPNMEEGRALLELYSLNVFKKADDADRAGRSDTVVAKLFYVSSILMEVSKQFGELSEDIVEKQKYARWKAAEITRAIKNGVQPQSGPYMPDNTTDADGEQQQQQQQHEAPAFAIPQHQPQPQPQPQQHNQSHAEEDDTSFEARFANLKSASEMHKPTAAAMTPSPTASYQQPAPSQSPTGYPNAFSSTTSPTPPSYSSSPSPAAAPQPRQQSQPQQSQPAKPSYTPQATSQASQQSRTTSGSGSGSSAAGSGKQPTLDDMMNAQKHAKYAVSSLQFNDARTAIKNLRTALEILGGL